MSTIKTPATADNVVDGGQLTDNHKSVRSNEDPTKLIVNKPTTSKNVMKQIPNLNIGLNELKNMDCNSADDVR